MVGLTFCDEWTPGFRGTARRVLRASAFGLLLTVLSGCASAPPPPSVTAVLVNGGSVQDAGGQVQVVRAGSPAPARPGLALQPGDEVHTGPGAQAVLSLEGGRVEVIVFENTQVVLGSLFTKIGKVVVRVLKKVQDQFEVESEYAVAGAEGTQFLVAVGPDQEYRCAVLEGVVDLHSPAGQWPPVSISRGQEAVGRPGVPVTTRELDRRELNDLVREVNEVVRASDDRAELVAPDVTGLPEGEARRTLEAHGLAAGAVEPRITGRAPVGTVVEQRPPPGGRVRAGGRIDLTVEAEGVEVPALVRGDLRRAEALLGRAGLRGRAETRLVEGTADGVVLEQRPAPGALLARGATVELLVAERAVRVPNLVGSSQRVLSRALGSMELAVGQVSSRAAPGAPGTIVEQSPRPGTLVRPGTPVHVAVAVPCTVPDVRRMTLEAAQKALAGANLRSRIAQGGRSGTSGEEGRFAVGTQQAVVVGQEPSPGVRVQCGSAVVISLR